MTNPHEPSYALGHSEHELERLARQAGMFGPMTLRFLCEAGIGGGQRVLDLGTGAGDVVLLLAELVGPDGAVTGIDRAEPAIQQARARAETAGLRNVAFEIGDWTAPGDDGELDAVVGRLTLMYQPDPAAAVRAAAAKAKSGGVIGFQDIDFSFPGRAEPPSRVYSQAWAWIKETFRRSGAHIDLGMRLHGIFLDAGLPPPSLRLEAPLAGGSASGFQFQVAGVLRSLLPRMVELGIASEEEVGIDTLAERMAAEVDENRSQIVGPTLVWGWSRKP